MLDIVLREYKRLAFDFAALDLYYVLKKSCLRILYNLSVA